MEHHEAPRCRLSGATWSVLLSFAASAVPLFSGTGCEEASSAKEIKIYLDLPKNRLNSALRNDDQPYGEVGTLSASLTNLDEGWLSLVVKAPIGQPDRVVGLISYGETGAIRSFEPPSTLETGIPVVDGRQVMRLVCLQGPEPGADPYVAEVEIAVWVNNEIVTSSSKPVQCYTSDPNMYQLEMSVDPPNQKVGLAVNVQAKALDDAGQPLARKSLTFHINGASSSSSGADEREGEGTPATGRRTQSTREIKTDNDGEVRLAVSCPDQAGFVTVTVEYTEELYNRVPGITKSFSCFESTGTPQIFIQADRPSLTANNLDTTIIRLKVVDKLGVPQPGVEINVRVTLGAMALDPQFGSKAGQEPKLITAQWLKIYSNDSGDASFKFLGGTRPGVANFTAEGSFTPASGIPVEVKGEASLNIIGLGSISFVSADPEVLGVKGSGYHEQSTVTFHVKDTDGRDFGAGTLVNFSIEQVQQGAVDPRQATVNPAIGYTDAAGRVSTQLVSGYDAVPVSIRAEVKISEAAKLVVDSPAIPIIGVYPTSRGLTLVCATKNVGAFMDADTMRSNVEESIPCTLLMVDRFSNPVGVAWDVGFRAEAGSIGGTATSSALPAQGAIQANGSLGMATSLFSTFGSIPVDVEPLRRGAVTEPSRQVGNRTRNPRDGLVTVIAFTQGEEWFLDQNGNGLYDEGEPFEDLAEPFVDNNDNGIRDEDEPFIDLAIDGALPDGLWNGPNGRWNANTTIWTETRILYTGHIDRNNPEVGFIGVDLFQEDGPKFRIQKMQEQHLLFHAEDFNRNLLAASTQYLVSVEGSATLNVLKSDFPWVKDSWGIDWHFVEVCNDLPACHREIAFDSFGLFADSPNRSGYDMHLWLNANQAPLDCCCGIGQGEGDFFRSILPEGDIELPQCRPEIESTPEQPCDAPRSPRPVFTPVNIHMDVKQVLAVSNAEWVDVYPLVGLGCGPTRFSDNRTIEQRTTVCVSGRLQAPNGTPIKTSAVKIVLDDESWPDVPAADAAGFFCAGAPRGQISLTLVHTSSEQDPAPNCASDPLIVDTRQTPDSNCEDGGCHQIAQPLICKPTDVEPPSDTGVQEPEDGGVDELDGGADDGGNTGPISREVCLPICSAKARSCGFTEQQTTGYCNQVCQAMTQAIRSCLEATSCQDLASNPFRCMQAQ